LSIAQGAYKKPQGVQTLLGKTVNPYDWRPSEDSFKIHRSSASVSYSSLPDSQHHLMGFINLQGMLRFKVEKFPGLGCPILVKQ